MPLQSQKHIKQIKEKKIVILYNTITCFCSLEPKENDEKNSPINNKGTKFWNCFKKVSWKLPWSSVLDSSEI